MGDDPVERAIEGEPLERGLGSDFLHAWHVVHAVADQGQVIEHQARRHAELGLDAGFVQALVRHGIDQRDVGIHQLRQVLVAGGDDAAHAGLSGLARERADDVVGLDAVDHQQRPAQRGDGLVQRLDLAHEILGHRRAVRLVFGVPFVAESLALGVENAGEIVRLVVRGEPS